MVKKKEAAGEAVEKKKGAAAPDGAAGEKNDEKKEAGKSAPKDGELTDEQIKFARMNLRTEFNKRFSKWAEIDPKDADDVFIAEAKKDFEDEVEKNKNAKFKLAGAEDGLALKTAEFLRGWNEKYNRWEKGQWRGVIMFDKVVGKQIEELEADPKKPYEVGYETLMFLYYAMMNPNGSGLDSARAMAKLENYNEETDAPYEEDIPVTYSGILEKVQNHVKSLRAVDKKLNILKQRMDLAYGGLKMNLKVKSLEEFVQFSDAVNDVNASESLDEVRDEAAGKKKQ